jgi:hypothetical protein
MVPLSRCIHSSQLINFATGVLSTGRIDRQVEFGLATKIQCQRMWQRFL